MSEVVGILEAIIDRFERLDAAEDTADRFSCWSTAHSMADDAKRAINASRSDRLDLARALAYVIKTGWVCDHCGYNNYGVIVIWEDRECRTRKRTEVRIDCKGCFTPHPLAEVLRRRIGKCEPE